MPYPLRVKEIQTTERRSRIRVFLVDDHAVVRRSVRSYLLNHPIEIVGEASDAEECLRKVRKAAPQVVVLDVNLPGIGGGELACRLRKLLPKVKLIAFSMHASQEYVLKMSRCGVHGYVSKDEPAIELLEAIKKVITGGQRFPVSSPLTSRELEVLALLADGSSNKGIAAKLGITVRTAEIHRESLSHKLHISTVAGLTKYAILHGLTIL